MQDLQKHCVECIEIISQEVFLTNYGPYTKEITSKTPSSNYKSFDELIYPCLEEAIILLTNAHASICINK